MNTKAFFSYTKSLRKTNSIPNQVSFGTETANDRYSVSNLFAKYFASVFQHDCFTDFIVNQFTTDLQIYDITATEVKTILDELKRTIYLQYFL